MGKWDASSWRMAAIVAAVAGFFVGSYHGRSVASETHESIYKWLTPHCKGDVKRVIRNLEAADTPPRSE